MATAKDKLNQLFGTSGGNTSSASSKSKESGSAKQRLDELFSDKKVDVTQQAKAQTTVKSGMVAPSQITQAQKSIAELNKASDQSRKGYVYSTSKPDEKQSKVGDTLANRLREFGSGALDVVGGAVSAASKLPEVTEAFSQNPVFSPFSLLMSEEEKQARMERARSVGQPVQNLAQGIQDLADKLQPTEYLGSIDQKIGQLNRAIPTTLAASIASLTGLASVGALGTIGATSFGQKAMDLERQGITGKRQLLASLGSAIAEAVPETIGLGKEVKLIKSTGVGQAIKNFAETLIVNPAQEGATEVLNYLNDKILVNKDAQITASQVGNAMLDGLLMSMLFAGAKVSSVTLDNAIQSRKPITKEIVQQAKQEVADQGVNVDSIQNEVDAIKEQISQGAPIQTMPTEQATVQQPVVTQQVTDGNYERTSQIETVIQRHAREMLNELNSGTIKGHRYVITSKNQGATSIDGFGGVPRTVAKMFGRLLDNGWSYESIEENLKRVIEGKKDTKRSIVVKDMLEEQLNDGYTLADGQNIPPDQEYLIYREMSDPGYVERNFILNEDTNTFSKKIQYEPYLINKDLSTLKTVDELDNYENELAAEMNKPNNKWNLQMFAQKIKEVELVRENLRRSADSLANAGFATEESKQRTLDAVSEGLMDYQPITNKDTIEWARNEISTNPDVYERYLSGAYKGAEQTAIGIDLIRMAVNNNDLDAYDKLSSYYAEKLTTAGQEVQAASMLKRMTPEGMLLYADRTYDKAIQKLTKNELKKVPKKLRQDVRQKIKDIMQEAQALQGQERSDKVTEALQVIADNIPTSLTDKINSIINISLLLNPKTIFSRNLLSNVMFGTLENVKQPISGLIDIAVSKRTGKRETPIIPSIQAQAKGAKKGLETVARSRATGVNYSLSRGQAEIPRTRKMFNNKQLNYLYNLLGDSLKFGDEPFLQAAYDQRLDEMKRLGKELTEEDYQKALEFGLERTFQNMGQAALAGSQVKKGLNYIKPKGSPVGLGDIVIRYTTTPANILAKGFEYTPIGLIKTMPQATELFKKDISDFDQKAFTDSLARNITGTGIIGIGMLLYLLGMATGSDDKDPKKKKLLDRTVGVQPYSFKFGNKYYSFDWAQPVSIPLALGIDFAKALDSNKNPENILWDAFTGATGSLARQSMVSSLSRLFATQTNPISGSFESVANVPSMFVPTLFGQTASVVDENVRKKDYSNPLNIMIDSALSKIPFASSQLDKKYDAFFRPMKRYQGRSIIPRLTESYLSPGFYSEVKQDKVLDEMLRLAEVTGEYSTVPQDLSEEFTVKGKSYKIDNESMLEAYGNKVYSKYSSIISSSEYRKSSDKEKVKLLKNAMEEIADEYKDKMLTK